MSLLALAACGAPYSEDSERSEQQRQSVGDQDAFDGTLRVTVVDPPAEMGPPRTEEYLELLDGSYVPLERTAQAGFAVSGQRLRVLGRSVAGRIQADRLEPAETVSALDGSDEVLEVVVPRTTGTTKKIAVLLVSVSGATNTFDPDQVRTAVFGATGRSSRVFWEEGSFGKFTVRGHLREDGDVFGPYTISGACSFSNVVNASADAAMQAGVDLSPYDHVVRYTPAGASGCAGGGQGDQPGRNTIIFGIGINALWDYVGHEVGHNFGCGHASSYDNCQGRFAGDCQHNEYGDPTDIMGRRNGHYMSYYKDALGWLDPANKASVTASQRVRLFPIEQAASGLQSVLVPRGDGTQLHLEFRRPLGFDSFLETGVTDGVLLRYLPSGGGGLPHLINFGTQNTAVDSALEPGASFTDGNREIRVVEADGESALVDIVIDGVPPSGEAGTGGAGTGGTGGGTSGGTGGIGGGTSGGMGGMGGSAAGSGGTGSGGGDGGAGLGGSSNGGSAGSAASTGIGGTSGGAGSGAAPAGGTSGSAAGSGGRAAGPAATDSAPALDGGCGCRVTGGSSLPAGRAWLAMLGFLVALRRRTRRAAAR